MNDGEYTIRAINLPERVGGFIAESPDGHINIYVNAKWGHNAQVKAIEHELDHWRNDDLHNGRDIREVEWEDELPPIVMASELQRPGRRHDRAELQMKQERMDDLKNDVYFNMPIYRE